jgi:hypothetical protein
VIAAWPSFALIGAYELLMRQVRRGAAGSGKSQHTKPAPQISRRENGGGAAPRPRYHSTGPDLGSGLVGHGGAGRDLQRQAWRWALAHRASDGSLPSGREIARHYGRHERWGRLVKRAGAAGQFATQSTGPGMRLVDQRPTPAPGE